jgi:CBS domain-containing protein
MAIAGPAVSLVLAVAFWVLAVVGQAVGWEPSVVVVLAFLSTINGWVLLFNLVPAFPLDGGRVLRSILWAATGQLRRATYWASLAGEAFAWFLIAFGIFLFFFGREFWLDGIWLGLIGLFLRNASLMGYQQVLIRQTLQGEPIERFMTRNLIVVPPTLDLQHWVDDYVYRNHRRNFPVVSGDRLEGFIDTQALAHMPRNDWERHTVGEVMLRDLEGLTIAPHADALEALTRIQQQQVSRLLVTDGDRLLGVVSLKDLLRFLSLKLDLERAEPSDTMPPPGLRRVLRGSPSAGSEQTTYTQR